MVLARGGGVCVYVCVCVCVFTVMEKKIWDLLEAKVFNKFWSHWWL